MKWYVLGRDDCTWCDRAADELQKRGETFEYHLYTANPMLLKLMFVAGMKTVPQIWYGGQHIGGYDDLVQFFQNDMRDSQ
jgi:glutaredoxin